MSGLVNALVIVAVGAMVITRQVRARAIDTDRRWWVLPVVLAVIALREPGVLDPHHRTESAALLAVELLIGLATGAGWAWTTRVWTAPDGVIWTKSTKASAAVWVAGIALRAGVFALGSVLGLHQDSSALLLGLAATLLVRAGILARRARFVSAVSGPAPAYGNDNRSARKERV
ncbi:MULTISPECIES: DUF1453 family protein [Streptomyces]|uniref:DUF1453 family protein n=1 Tax=Streptomyces TaxID=1883 RepID=UPI00073DD132|nr:DUF1453 family protein [Streptomyces sp. EAS-AB2608]MYU30521.1 DUF1453 family protein [Streptomyces sp. SID7810]BCM69987.1 hypothetical protein EASAB2608_05321 [Streptomyces sp. EAS-AB2608]CUW31591.1 hypothetical protein TUE45_06339 [Streptomyces reticuli]